MKELTSNKRRQLIDTQQVYEAWISADDERSRRFVGSMRWLERNGREYLFRRLRGAEKSLGPASQETRAIYEAFDAGRQANKEKLQSLQAKLEEHAPVNVAMGLGRVPNIAARILRRCDKAGLLGTKLFVAGTNALFAYEVLAGVQVDAGLVATADIDLLLDARRKLSLVSSEFSSAGGLLGLLQRVDRSFSLPRGRSFRAANRDGYLVDLIRPEPKHVFRDRVPAALTDLPDDLEGAAIFGLDWLVNSPKVEATVIDDKGLPCRVVATDPRVFALHKAWLAEREDREPLKRRRDREQAVAAAEIAIRYLSLDFEAGDLSSLPARLRAHAEPLAEAVGHAPKSWHGDW
jgi:hypothetical protein